MTEIVFAQIVLVVVLNQKWEDPQPVIRNSDLIKLNNQVILIGKQFGCVKQTLSIIQIGWYNSNI